MFESRVIGIDVGIFARGELLQSTEPLDLRRVEYFRRQGTQAYGFVNGVVGVQSFRFAEGTEFVLAGHCRYYCSVVVAVRSAVVLLLTF